MDLHHRALFRWSRVSLLQLRRGMPEDHYVAASVEPSAYSRLRLGPEPDRRGHPHLPDHGASTYENRRVTTGALVVGPGAGTRPAGRSRPSDAPRARRSISPSSSPASRACTGSATAAGRCSSSTGTASSPTSSTSASGRSPRAGPRRPPVRDPEPAGDAEARRPGHRSPCSRPLPQGLHVPRDGDAVRGHVCLVLSPNQEIKVFAGGVHALRLRPWPLARARPGVEVRDVARRGGQPLGSPASSSRRPSTSPRSAGRPARRRRGPLARHRPADRPLVRSECPTRPGTGTATRDRRGIARPAVLALRHLQPPAGSGWTIVAARTPEWDCRR